MELRYATHPSINSSPQGGLEDTSFTKSLRKLIVGTAKTFKKGHSSAYLHAESSVAEMGS